MRPKSVWPSRGSRELSVQQARIFLGHGLQNLVIYSLVGLLVNKHLVVQWLASRRRDDASEEVTGSNLTAGAPSFLPLLHVPAVLLMVSTFRDIQRCRQVPRSVWYVNTASRPDRKHATGDELGRAPIAFSFSFSFVFPFSFSFSVLSYLCLCSVSFSFPFSLFFFFSLLRQ